MAAGWTAYIRPWNTGPMTTAAKMIAFWPLSIIGKAKKPQVPPVTAPTK